MLSKLHQIISHLTSLSDFWFCMLIMSFLKLKWVVRGSFKGEWVGVSLGGQRGCCEEALTMKRKFHSRGDSSQGIIIHNSCYVKTAKYHSTPYGSKTFFRDRFGVHGITWIRSNSTKATPNFPFKYIIERTANWVKVPPAEMFNIYLLVKKSEFI